MVPVVPLRWIYDWVNHRSDLHIEGHFGNGRHSIVRLEGYVA